MDVKGFNELNLSEEIVRAVSDMGFEEMSPIQAQAIPLLLEGKDVIGQAQTGTGKTAAFGIPIVESIDPNDRSVQAMVLCPTRELSIQVAEEIAKLAKYKRGIYALPIYGGQPIDRQIRGLKKGAQIVVGTPGRVIDHIQRRTLRTDNIKMFILDEADEMFDMGFREDIELVLSNVSDERQTTFFSATMAPEILSFAKNYQKDPELIKIVKKEMTVPKVGQYYYEMQSHMKTEILTRVLDIFNPTLALVFCNTKKMVDDLTAALQGKGYFADGLHGDLKQAQRDTVMNKFRSGTIDVLVATDVAARGLDVDDVDIVINYDLPQDDEYYVHRIGRTARAGREGTALSFVTGRDYYRLKDIQRYTKTTVIRRELPTLRDIEKNQTDKIQTIIIEEMEKSEKDEKAQKIVDILLEEDYSSYDIAAALVAIHMRENQYQRHDELDYVDNDKKLPRRDFSSERGRDRKRGGKGYKGRNKYDFVKIHLNAGSRKGISQRHILGALINEAGLERNKVGRIDVFDKFSYVEVPRDEAGAILRQVKGMRIKGFRISAGMGTPMEG